MKSIVTALVDPSGAADYGPDAYVEIWSQLPVGAGGTIATDKPLRVSVTAAGLSTPPIRAGNYLIRMKLAASRTALGPYPFTMPDGDGTTELWPLIAAGVNIPGDTPIQKIQEALAAYLVANPIDGNGLDQTAVDTRVQTVGDTRYAPIDETVLGWAQAGSYNLITATRNAGGGLTGGTLRWPDGATGVITTTLSTADASLNAINAYALTHVLAGVTTTYTQPTMTRDATTGAVTAQPALVVS
ncbi:hypothetical protein [Rhodococcus sp. NPDC006774]|uniref:hypothetical protein n=1 Tax=Rhodococcus sp. NPDC006774 TaxID=3157186 RepID=UPI00340C4A9C